MNWKKPSFTLIFLFFLLFGGLVQAEPQYYAYPGECIQIQSDYPLICIPANASANETFKLTYNLTMEIPEIVRTEYIQGVVIKYENITNVTTIIQNQTQNQTYIPEKINETIENLKNLNEILKEREELILKLINESQNKISEIENELIILFAFVVILILFLYYFTRKVYPKS